MVSRSAYASTNHGSLRDDWRMLISPSSQLTLERLRSAQHPRYWRTDPLAQMDAARFIIAIHCALIPIAATKASLDCQSGGAVKRCGQTMPERHAICSKP